MPEKVFLKDIEVSKKYGIGLSTLRNDRMLGRGIPYAKLGRAILYGDQDCQDFMDSHKIKTKIKN